MNENIIEIIWEKAKEVPGYDKNKWRQDFAGAWILRNQYGIRSEYGWEIDHLEPRNRGGSDDPSNLIPIHWRNNISKSGSYPEFQSVVSSDGDKNIDKEQSWRITK